MTRGKERKGKERKGKERKGKERKGKDQYLGNHPDGWAAKGAGNSKPTQVFKTQCEAIQKAEEIAKNQKTDTKIQRVDRKFRAGNSYGNDPFPPKDTK